MPKSAKPFFGFRFTVGPTTIILLPGANPVFFEFRSVPTVRATSRTSPLLIPALKALFMLSWWR
ncbi:MAG: hypothetical protein IPN83_07195 [Holophagales bacterium]|nr:hypothetical protein [Holophagales bacterium]